MPTSRVNPLAFATILAVFAVFNAASVGHAENAASTKAKEAACAAILHVAPTVVADDYFTSDAELALLGDLSNGLAMKMQSAWVEASGVPLKTDHFFDASLAAIKAKYLNAASAANMDERRNTHTPVRKDGTQLVRGTSHRSVERLADLWKQLTIELLPDVDPTISEVSVEALAERLANPTRQPDTDVLDVGAQDFTLLSKIENGLLRSMLKTIRGDVRDEGRVSIHASGGLKQNFAVVAEYALSDKPRAFFLERIEKLKLSDGAQLLGLSTGAASLRPSPEVLMRFLETWRLLAVALDHDFKSMTPLDPDNIAKVSALLEKPKTEIPETSTDEESSAFEETTPAKLSASPEAVRLPQKKKKVDDKVGSLTTEDMKLVTDFISQNSGGDWFAHNRAKPALTTLMQQVLLPTEATKLDILLTHIGFLQDDPFNARSPGKAQRKVLLAMRLLADVVAPKIASAPMSAAWVMKLSGAYDKQIARMEKGKAGLVLQSKAVTTTRTPTEAVEDTSAPRSPAPDNSSPSGAAETIDTSDVKPEVFIPDDILPDKTEVLFDSTVDGPSIFADVNDFKKFMINYAYLGASSSTHDDELDIPYFKPGVLKALKISYVVERNPQTQQNTIRIKDAYVIGRAEEKALYEAIAIEMNFKHLTFQVSEARPLKIDGTAYPTIHFAAATMVKILIKHRTTRDSVVRVLSLVKNLMHEIGKDYIAKVFLGGQEYRVVVVFKGGLYGASVIPLNRRR